MVSPAQTGQGRMSKRQSQCVRRGFSTKSDFLPSGWAAISAIDWAPRRFSVV
jgi:hypothetical protein